jgi:hypothetical protein
MTPERKLPAKEKFYRVGVRPIARLATIFMVVAVVVLIVFHSWGFRLLDCRAIIGASAYAFAVALGAIFSIGWVWAIERIKIKGHRLSVELSWPFLFVLGLMLSFVVSILLDQVFPLKFLEPARLFISAAAVGAGFIVGIVFLPPKPRPYETSNRSSKD